MALTFEDLRQQDLSDMRAILSTREGARFFSHLMDRCGIFRLSYEAEDTHATAFKEGQRNIGLMMLACLEEIEPDASAILRGADRKREVNDG